MAQLTRIVISYGQTIPTPIDASGRNFTYTRADAELEALLEPGDSEAEVVGALWKMARRNVAVQLQPAVAAGDAAVRKIWLGLPEAQREALFPHLTAAQARAVWSGAPNERASVKAIESDGTVRTLDTAALSEGD